MTAPTLTEFLLARIAEDEDRVVMVERLGGWAKGMGPDRLLAECEAKRRIVQDRIYWGTVNAGPILAHSEWVCRVLAMTYAEHPGYDEAWRP